MIEIRPHCLYSREDLIEILRPLKIDADGFIARLKPVKRFRLAWFGEDLLQAIRDAPELGEVDEKISKARMVRRARGKTGARVEGMEELKRIQRGE